VVSKEEVAVGRKGSGGAWMGVDQPECGGGGRASPTKWPNTNNGEKKSETFGRSAVGCNLVVLKMTCSQSGCKVQTHFLAPPVRAIRGAY
jgi:hypothetical protein